MEVSGPDRVPQAGRTADLTLVGFFEELAHGGPGGGSLVAAVAGSPDRDQEHIVRYLRAGTVMGVAAGATVDVLDPAHPRLNTLTLLTDGVYEWPNDLPYFVERYNARLPVAFVEHMRKQEWVCPAVEDQSVRHIVIAQQRSMEQQSGR